MKISFCYRSFALIGLAIVGGIWVSAASAQTVLKTADIQPDGYPTVEAVKFMGKLIEERTKGRIRTQTFHSAQLGAEKDTIEQTRLGVIDINRVNLAPYNDLIPETTITSLPFIFRSVEHMRKILDGPIGNDLLKKFEEQGVIGLAFYDSGGRSFYNTKRPIRTPEDVKGLKIRVQQSNTFIALVNSLGGVPTPMPITDVLSGLKTGVIDGAENNWPTYESSKHYEVAKFYSLTEHSLTPEVLVMSKVSFDKLTGEDQAIIRAAAKESVMKMRELWDAREKLSEEKVRAAGVQVNTVENKQPFIDAFKPLYDEASKNPALKQLIDAIQATM